MQECSLNKNGLILAEKLNKVFRDSIDLEFYLFDNKDNLQMTCIINHNLLQTEYFRGYDLHISYVNITKFSYNKIYFIGCNVRPIVQNQSIEEEDKFIEITRLSEGNSTIYTFVLLCSDVLIFSILTIMILFFCICFLKYVRLKRYEKKYDNNNKQNYPLIYPFQEPIQLVPIKKV